MLAIINSSIGRATTGEDYESLKDIVQCEQCAVERRKFVRKLLIEEVSRLIRNPCEGSTAAMSLVSGAKYEKPPLRLQELRYAPTVSSEVAAEIKSKVKTFVHGQAMNSKIFAVANLTWYGEITELVVRQHGVITYFLGISGNHVGMDGFACVALAVSAKYSSFFDTGLTESAAMRALKIFGRVRINSPPIQWHLIELPGSSGRMPDEVWEELLGDVQSKPDTCLGMVYAMLVSNMIQYIRGNRSSEKVSEDMIPRLATKLLAESLRNNPLSVRLQELISQGHFSFTPELHMPKSGLPASQMSSSAATRTSH